MLTEGELSLLMENETIVREEFDHLIAEFEAFKDNHMDEITKLTQDIETLKEEIREIKSSIKESSSDSQSQTKLA